MSIIIGTGIGILSAIHVHTVMAAQRAMTVMFATTISSKRKDLVKHAFLIVRYLVS